MQKKLEKVVTNKISEALKSRIFPGISAAVLFKESSQWKRLFFSGGKTGYGANYSSVKSETFFDIASLTKPLCTVPCLLHLIKSNKISFDTKIGKFFNFKKGSKKEKIEIKHLLSHCSGFDAYKPFFKDFKSGFFQGNKKKMINKICDLELIYETGEKNIYSDLGFILLGQIIEDIAGCSLDIFFKKWISEPLYISDQLLFNPLDKKISRSTIAATEKCDWRKKILHGEVHDEHCFLMGGKAGHAGLFGTIHGVASLCESIFDQWQDNKDNFLLLGDLFKGIFISTNEKSTWYRGFDKPSGGISSSGKYFSPESAGHLGFTGTSFWMDPNNNIIIILLTNRVHLTRENTAIRQFRPLFHDVVMQTLLEGKI